ncbi:hypothetical protein RJ640_024600 [Escallonia rubra]|uniref:Retrotransposon gag domain-containing protein n=1 Tax=Escallonia rubra TaxID=112253 RepID=A0AA88UWM9_9ASTE|nr:hypothetical protein RJ640_024600 [Escallonia rubra]
MHAKLAAGGDVRKSQGKWMTLLSRREDDDESKPVTAACVLLTMKSASLNRCENDCLPNIDWVLALAKAAVLRHGVRGLVIDPYNELDHQRRANQLSQTPAVTKRHMMARRINGGMTSRMMTADENADLTWQASQDRFFTKYFPPNVKEVMESDFMRIAQHPNETITEYEERFMKLSRFALHIV